jgi:hypothetical protein
MNTFIFPEIIQGCFQIKPISLPKMKKKKKHKPQQPKKALIPKPGKSNTRKVETTFECKSKTIPV